MNGTNISVELFIWLDKLFGELAEKIRDDEAAPVDLNEWFLAGLLPKLAENLDGWHSLTKSLSSEGCDSFLFKHDFSGCFSVLKPLL